MIPRGRLLRITVIALLACTAAVVLWVPVTKMFAGVQINYNEGWNAARVAMLEKGEQLYAAPPVYIDTNYPPISFHFTALLARITGNANLAGRWTAMLSLLGICAVIGLMVWTFTANAFASVWAGLTFVICVAVFAPDRPGMNDPHLLAMLLMSAGLYVFFRSESSVPLLCASAAMFALSLFTKDNLVAIPAAVGLHLLMSGPIRRFLVWTGTFCAATGALFAATIWLDGPFFIAHLTAARAYSILQGWLRFTYFVWIFEIAIAAAAIWAIRNWRRPDRQVLVLAFPLTMAFALLFAGGTGVDFNIFFDCMLVIVLMVSIGLADLMPLLERARSGSVLLIAALLLPLLGVFTLLPTCLQSERQEVALLADTEDDTAKAVEAIESKSGAALCEDLLFCVEAGKPYLFDPYFVYNQIKTGRLAEEPVLEMLRSHRFSTVEVAVGPAEPSEHVRFTAAFMRTLLEYYRPVLTARNYVILVPM